jgi:hypothetical protein
MRRLIRMLRAVLWIGAALLLGLETAYLVVQWILRLRIFRILSEP